jgi:EpsD family peptidyl-prolyl cis-trans isomerase
MILRHIPARRVKRVSASLLAICVLAACGGSEAPKVTQAVARVNDREISVHQVNMMAQRLPANLPAERVAEARRAIVNGLVEQETLVQYATEHKLDREVQTLQQLEAARREVLARAALERLGSQSPRPTPGEVQEYFDSNPALFAKRRVYRFDEIVLPGVPVEWAAIEKQVASARSLREVSSALRARGRPRRLAPAAARDHRPGGRRARGAGGRGTRAAGDRAGAGRSQASGDSLHGSEEAVGIGQGVVPRGIRAGVCDGCATRRPRTDRCRSGRRSGARKGCCGAQEVGVTGAEVQT